MFDDVGKAKMNYYKVVSDKKGKGHGIGKPYNRDKGKKKDVGGGSKANVAEVKCFKCNDLISILLFLVALHILFEVINNYVICGIVV